MKLAKAASLFTFVAAAAWAQVDVGEQKPESGLPFTTTTVANFKLPWRLAFVTDGRMLVTEKVGSVFLVSQKGEKIEVGNTPPSIFRARAACVGSSYRPITPPTTVSSSPMPGRAIMAVAWGWRAKLNATATSANWTIARRGRNPDQPPNRLSTRQIAVGETVLREVAA